MKNEKTKRIISGIIIVVITFPLLFFTHTLALTVYMLFVATVGVFELLRCLKLDKWYVIVPAECLTVASHVLVRLRLFGGTDIGLKKFAFIFICMIVCFTFYLFGLCVFIPDKFNIETSGFGSLMCVYIVSGTLAATLLTEKTNGEFLFPLIFISAWMTDLFAYIIGMKFGKHKLCPTVSPKKSVEGAIGGVFGNIIGFIIYALVITFAFNRSVASYPVLIVTAVILSVISQLGDLILSLVKRRFGIKDFGKIIPGHGGVLDRFDSITAVSVAIYITYTVIEAVKWTK
ncbi:MAG: CDP-archaeol synthase [Clostridia bacterium]|nr:CDP-archaeol synthase [Clostridia bacterium]